ncbi:MAG: GAF domain-containing protein [Bacteroidia bacterium]|nr:GAF domain-containing protein [Bacteroidia bacterium]
MISEGVAKTILSESEAILAQAERPIENRLSDLMQFLHDRIPHAYWVGIYWLEGEELKLGPYAGPPTEHTCIPVGRGVCGTAVAERKDQIVADVRTCTNYLACNPETLSEIVVLIYHPESGDIIGQIDIDGNQVGAFDESDRALLGAIADKIAHAIWRS